MNLTQLLQILVLAIVQGLAELLPVSSSAHVTIAARLMNFDLTTDPKKVYAWTFLLVMLHTGTMFSVLIYFWSRWKKLATQIPALIVATLATGIIGYPLMQLLKKLLLHGDPTAPTQEIEQLFLNLPLMACSLAAIGILIIIAGLKDEKSPATLEIIDLKRAAAIGATQGLALPFRGFSRSGSTISVALLSGIARLTAEEFSFALAVIITPVVIAREVWMLIKDHGQPAVDAAAASAEHHPTPPPRPPRHALQLPRRPSRPPLALHLARTRSLEILRFLLLVRGGGCAGNSRCRLIKS